MKLSDYLAQHDITHSEFGRRVGLPQATVWRYVNGHRIPEPENMARIVAETGGAVTPNDFYPEAIAS